MSLTQAPRPRERSPHRDNDRVQECDLYWSCYAMQIQIEMRMIILGHLNYMDRTTFNPLPPLRQILISNRKAVSASVRNQRHQEVRLTKFAKHLSKVTTCKYKQIYIQSYITATSLNKVHHLRGHIKVTTLIKGFSTLRATSRQPTPYQGILHSPSHITATRVIEVL